MKKLYRNIDTEVVFYEDNLEEAKKYYSVQDDEYPEDYSDCESLEELACKWNSNNAGNGIGEMIVETFGTEEVE